MSPVFEHLDDDRPPVAGAAARDAVAGRVAARHAARVRRQRIVLIAGLSAMIPVLAVLVVLAGRDEGKAPASVGTTSSSAVTSTTAGTTGSSVPPGATTTTEGTTATTTVPPVGAPLQYITDTDFTSADRGYLVGVGNCSGDDCAQLRATTDGGVTWETIPAPPVSANLAAGYQVRFGSTTDGYVFGADLWVTHDRGATWAKVDGITQVLGLEPEGADVWALVKPCDQSQACRLALASSGDSGRSWATDLLPSDAVGQQGGLVRQSPSVAWVVASDVNGPVVVLEGTSDAGATWTQLPVPCPDPQFEADVTFVDADHLWLACAADAGAGQQGKTVFRSSDAGVSWEPTAALPLSGLLGNVAASAVDRAFVALTSGTLMATTDNGASWHDALPVTGAGPGNGGVGPVRFVDPTHGWVAGRAGGGAPVVWRTTDGGSTWTAVGVD